ncbi:MAG: hypothetical protein ABI995_11610, partial [Acidobacteriota bacterium]
WHEDDTTIYRVPQVTASLAHVMNPSRLVAHVPIHGLDVGELRNYVSALEDASAPPAELHWRGANEATVRAQLAAADVVSLQINYHPGWHATVGGEARRVYADGLGLMAIDAQCVGDCEIALAFDGGTETKACLAAAGALLLAVIATCLRNAASVRLGMRGFRSAPSS